MPIINEGDFYQSINQAISENRHVDYLKEVIKKYEEYKKAFAHCFTSERPSDSIYEFRVTYLLKKSVWRDIELFGEQTFLDLAEKIIDSMGWENDHMHGFELPEQNQKPDLFLTGSSNTFFAPGWEDDPHPTYKTDEICIQDIDYKKVPQLGFTFDFGDGHMFDIVFKASRERKKGEKVDGFPKIVDQRGVGPEQYPDCA